MECDHLHALRQTTHRISLWIQKWPHRFSRLCLHKDAIQPHHPCSCSIHRVRSAMRLRLPSCCRKWGQFLHPSTRRQSVYLARKECLHPWTTKPNWSLICVKSLYRPRHRRKPRGCLVRANLRWIWSDRVCHLLLAWCHRACFSTSPKHAMGCQDGSMHQVLATNHRCWFHLWLWKYSQWSTRALQDVKWTTLHPPNFESRLRHSHCRCLLFLSRHGIGRTSTMFFSTHPLQCHPLQHHPTTPPMGWCCNHPTWCPAAQSLWRGWWATMFPCREPQRPNNLLWLWRHHPHPQGHGVSTNPTKPFLHLLADF